MSAGALAIAWLVAFAAVDEKEVFPLAVGNQWVYRGTLTRGKPDPACDGHPDCKVVIEHLKLDCPMKVTAVASTQGARAALLEGHPQDLVWLQGDPRPLAWLIVRTDDGRHFLLAQRNGESLAALMNDPEKLRSRLNERDVFLRWPFPDNRLFGCDPEVNVPSQPARNCWRVTGHRRFAPSHIRGAPARASNLEYDLEYRTMPEDIAVRFSPRLGITRFAFHHHGSTYDLDLRLVSTSLHE